MRRKKYEKILLKHLVYLPISGLALHFQNGLLKPPYYKFIDKREKYISLESSWIIRKELENS
jgi:hypothetical protein